MPTLRRGGGKVGAVGGVGGVGAAGAVGEVGAAGAAGRGRGAAYLPPCMYAGALWRLSSKTDGKAAQRTQCCRERGDNPVAHGARHAAPQQRSAAARRTPRVAEAEEWMVSKPPGARGAGGGGVGGVGGD